MSEKTKTILKQEFLNGRTKWDWLEIALGLILQIVVIIADYLNGNPDNSIAIVCAISGVLVVTFCAQGKITYNIFNFIQVITYIIAVAFPSHLYGELVEYFFYLATSIWGIYVWKKNYRVTESDDSLEVKGKNLTAKGWTVLLSVLAVGTALVTWLLSLTNDPAPFLDSISTTPAFIAQVLMCAGYREQWLCWFIIDITSVIMYITLGNWIMVAMFSFWCFNCLYGWVKWTRSVNKR